jgi:hypothetical protein
MKKVVTKFKETVFSGSLKDCKNYLLERGFYFNSVHSDGTLEYSKDNGIELSFMKTVFYVV